MRISRHRVFWRHGAALLVFALSVVVWFHGVVEHPGSRIPVGFTDATGTLRDYWAASVQHRTPFTFTHDALAGAPGGSARTPATLLANGGLQAAFVWGLRGPLGLVGAWNAFLFLGMIATGMAMFTLLSRLGCTFVASLFGAYVFAFSPYAFERAYAGHLALLQNWVIVLVAGALLVLGERRSFIWAAGVGLAIALAFYDSAYEGLLAAFMTFVFCLVELVRVPGRREWLRSLALGGFAYLVTVVALVPILVLYAQERSAVQSTTFHPVADFSTYAARLPAYFLPSPRNPLFHWLRAFHPTHLTEQALFFGYATWVLAVACVVLLCRRDPWLRVSKARRWTAVYMATLVPTAFVMSLAPRLRIGPVSVPMPSSALEWLTSFWRVYSRFGLLAGLGLAVLAAFALTSFSGRPGRGWSFLAPAALAVVVLELLPANMQAFDTTARPAWVAWLATQPRGITVSYPNSDEVARADEWYQTLDRQPRFELPLGEQQIPLSRTMAIRLLAVDVREPVTASVLATEGVRYVIVHDDQYPAGIATRGLAPGRFRLLKRFGDVRILAVTAPGLDIGPALKAHGIELAARQGVVPPSMTYGDGFNAPEKYDGATGRWMIQDGVLELHNSGPSMQVMLVGVAFSNQRSRLLEVEDGTGRVLDRQLVTVASTSLDLGPIRVPRGRSTLMLVARPGPGPLGPTDPRVASIFLWPINPAPLPIYARRG